VLRLVRNVSGDVILLDEETKEIDEDESIASGRLKPKCKSISSMEINYYQQRSS